MVLRAKRTVASNGCYPEGTFNYTDPQYYSPAKAMDLMNGVLLTKGYTLGDAIKMLMVVNLKMVCRMF